MPPTPYEPLNGVLCELVAGVQRELGQVLAGAYLQGSFAVGDFDEHSDVDFIVVLDRDLTPNEVKRLNALHERIYLLESEWAKHLEGSYFPRDVLRAEPGQPVWYLDHGSRTLERSAHCNTLVVRWALEHHGIVLAGPDPKAFFDSVPTDALRREILRTMFDCGRDILVSPERYANRFYQGFIVLSYCRMMDDLWAGRIGSKRSGAHWATANLPTRWHGLISRAWDTRIDPAVSVRTPADPVEFSETLEFVKYALKLTSPPGAEGERLQPSGSG